MKSLFLISSLLVFCVLLISCNKKNSDTPSPADKIAGDYLQLKVGNYWVYDWYNRQDESFTYSSTDSVYISRDTVYQGKHYYILVHSRPYGSMVKFQLLRDSSGCLLEGNVITFSSTNFKDTLTKSYNTITGDSIFEFCRMNKGDTSITVPYGTFITYASKFTAITPKTQPKYSYSFFAEGIGLIKKTYAYLSGNSGFEQRLIRYGKK